MQSQLQAAVNQLCAEKNLEKETVLAAIENAIALAYKKDFGRPGQRIAVHLGDDISDLRIFEIREVVTKVEDYDLDITMAAAKKIRPDAKMGDEVFVPLELPKGENFGRIAAQTAKHVMMQKLQEEEREMLFDKFKDREGQLLTAKVQKVDRDCALVEIEGITTMIMSRQQIPGEKYFTGQRIKVWLESVEQTSRGPQLRINRTSNEFIEALFAAEIPEMAEGLVRVAKMVREPGVRCKIAVQADDSSVDPVGTFVGQKGSRINVVMTEVGDERLDIIQFYEDPKKMLLASLSPAKIAKVEFFTGEEGDDRVRIFVRESERAVTIGKRGQNVRLAGDLIGMQIDVMTFEGTDEEDESMIKSAQPAQKSKKNVSEKVGIEHLEGVGPETISTLKELGLSQIKMLEGLAISDYTDIGLPESEGKILAKAVEKYLEG